MINSAIKYLKKCKFLNLILAIAGTLFIMAATNKESAKIKVIPVIESHYKTVVFDLGGVLFSTNSATKNNLILYTLMSNPTLLYHLINFDTKAEYFKLLHQIPAESNLTMHHQSEPMPQIMVDWQIGLITPKELKEKVINHIQQSNHSVPIQNLCMTIAEFMFTPQTLAHSQISIRSMVRLAKELKHAGYKLFALSNWDEYSFQIMKEQHPEIFELFNGIVISGEEKIGKPSSEFYQKLIEKYKLNPSECIFIDDEIINIQTAQEIGFQSIVCNKPTQVMQELIDLGILTRNP